MSSIAPLTRRSAILGAAGTALFATTGGRAVDEQIITVHKDPSCGCCSGWVKHLQQAGFAVATIETADLEPVKTRLGVPADLAACHTAQIGGLGIEGPLSPLAPQGRLARKAGAGRVPGAGMAAGAPRLGGRSPPPR